MQDCISAGNFRLEIASAIISGRTTMRSHYIQRNDYCTRDRGKNEIACTGMQCTTRRNGINNKIIIIDGFTEIACEIAYAMYKTNKRHRQLKHSKIQQFQVLQGRKLSSKMW